MAVKISNLMIMMVMGISVFMGMMTFMGEMDDNYGISQPTNSSEDLDTIFDDINSSTTSIQRTLTGDKSWLETSWSIVFALPQTVMGTLSTMANSAGKLMSVAQGEDMVEMTIPGWVVSMIAILIGIIIITTLVYLILGRGL